MTLIDKIFFVSDLATWIRKDGKLWRQIFVVLPSYLPTYYIKQAPSNVFFCFQSVYKTLPFWPLFQVFIGENAKNLTEADKKKGHWVSVSA